MLSPLKLTDVTPGDRRKPPADIKCPPAVQRKQASAFVFMYRWSGEQLRSILGS